jgi:hypothetical protein
VIKTRIAEEHEQNKGIIIIENKENKATRRKGNR